MNDERSCQLSIVVPVYNEEGSLEQLYAEITEVLTQNTDFEIIFVDDGSTDKSREILRKLHSEDGRVRVIYFRKNFGQTAALAAGFENSKGKIVVPLDADRQNDPVDIPALINKLDEGYDIVSGWRKERHDNTVTRTFPSRVANWLIGRITGVRLHDFGCTLKAYRWESIRHIKLYGEMHRFIPALASWGGERVAEIVVNHRARTTGKTKYGLNRTFKVVLDLITIKFLASFSTKPLYVFGGIGGVCGFGAVVSGATVLYQKCVNQFSMNKNPLLILTTLLIITSLQFIMMGLLAEILVRTYHESQGRPIYVVEEMLG